MPSLGFYAAASDFPSILELVMVSAGCRVFEAYSRPGETLRELASVAAALEVAADAPLTQLSLYAPGSGGEFRIDRFALNADAHPPALWREEVVGWGLIQLILQRERERGLGPSMTSHNSLKRAEKWSPIYPDYPPVEPWSFAEVTRVSARINRTIRNQLAVARAGSRPILPGAQALVQAGTTTLLSI